jgi:hypothetical protein
MIVSVSALTGQMPEAVAANDIISDDSKTGKSAVAMMEQGGWPREIQTDKGLVVLYQPQPESLDDDKLKARAAVSVELSGSDEPQFGAVWFDTRIETDRDQRMATIVDAKVTRMRFAVEDKKKGEQLRKLLETEIPKWKLPLDMDRLLASLAIVEKQVASADKISVEAPKILFMEEPAVLISLDGEPRLQKVDGTKLMRVVNTPFTMLFDTGSKTWYLSAGKGSWNTATNINGDWKVTKDVPKDVAKLEPEEDPDNIVGETDKNKEDKGDGKPPKVVVATEPTELISSTGKPEYTPIKGTDLLYMSNTDSDVLMDINSQENYVLLSGRWYAGKSMDGPWSYVASNKLPADFAKIPEDSNMGTVLYAVAGTNLAQEAVLDTQIPQTAAIERSKATLKVEYDGKPEFEKISGTSLQYAVNTATPVIKSGKKYYAVDEAVWFVADKPEGPWQLATSIPAEIYTIPADSPVYNVTFVRIYKVTDDIIYVGYTPGYTNTYVYGSTIVYGTGYWWPGWYGRWYYPRPATWGFHVRWNPWGGWGFGLSYSTGPFTFSIGRGGWYRGGWWGPGRYRSYNRGYSHGARAGSYAGYRAGYRAGQRSDSNLYRSDRNKARASSISAADRSRAKISSAVSAVDRSKVSTAAASKRPNNVYADKNGDIHRKTDKGWENRTNDGWQSSQTQLSKSEQRSQSFSDIDRSSYSSSRDTTSRQLDRSSQARQRGSQRASSFSSAGGRGGGMRGGGGRGGGRR